MIKYIIPGFYEHFYLNIALIKLKETNPEFFYDDVDIYCSYGNFQWCLWDGGRIFYNTKQASKESIEYIYNTYKELNIPIRFIFTNNQLKETDFYDRFCNLCLELCEDEKTEIVLANDKLEEYIREKYPKYKNFISSTTKCITSLSSLKEELSNTNHFLTCFDYNLNRNPEIFNLTQEEKDKSEMLCNAICGPGCPHRKEHYRLNSLYSLSYGQKYQMKQCYIKYPLFSPEWYGYKNNLYYSDLQEYNKQGFSYFKLEGRTWDSKTMASMYCLYMIKSEHYLQFLNLLLIKEEELHDIIRIG